MKQAILSTPGPAHAHQALYRVGCRPADLDQLFSCLAACYGLTDCADVSAKGPGRVKTPALLLFSQ
jgi:hypothetical protein